MALFCAPAWMMKGGGGGAASINGTMFDDDPYKQGKTKVKLRMSDVKLTISNNKTKFIIRYNVTNVGFTENAANVQFRLELRVGGHWRYTNVLNTLNLSSTGSGSTNISTQINKSGQVKQLLTNPEYGNVHSDGRGNCYILFETNTEICDDQIKCEIETV